MQVKIIEVTEVPIAGRLVGFVLNDAAAADQAVQMAMQSYMNRLQADAQRSQAIREGRISNDGQSGNWNISDRH